MLKRLVNNSGDHGSFELPRVQPFDCGRQQHPHHAHFTTGELHLAQREQTLSPR
jgi:hypothetical protein